MSELKARHVVDVYDNYAEHPCKDYSQVYLKSEADKFIEDLEESHKKEVEQLLMEIVELKEKLKINRDARKYWRKEYSIEHEEARHNKYKRCLAMAKACREKSERMYCEASSLKALNEILGKEPKDAVVEKFELWGAIASTHRKIWLALADEPTWAKFLQLIHKECK